MDAMGIERPGAWRAPVLVAVFALAALPSAPILAQAFLGLQMGEPLWTPGFAAALGRSAALALVASVLGWMLGLPAGVLAALADLPARRVLLALAVLPLLAPSFLWALGWSRLAGRLGPAAVAWIEGRFGPTLVDAAAIVPLAALAAAGATLAIGGSRLDAARLAGGEWAAFRAACRHAAAPALAAALLGGALRLSDPGPAQVFGHAAAASEILTSFAARHDFLLAGRQCAVLASVVLLGFGPFGAWTAPRLAAAVLGRQTQPLRRTRSRDLRALGLACLLLQIACGLVVPLVGLLLPLSGGLEAGRALQTLRRTAADTLFYSGGGAAAAVVLGFLAAIACGREPRRRTAALAASLILLALPASLPALGFARLAAMAPAWADPIVRGRIAVAAALGLHFFPVAALLGLRAWGAIAPSWTQAAAVHGVPLGRHFARVLFPILARDAAAAFTLVALLAAADIGTVLILHPPGASSLPLAVFTVMANAPESLVASLCLTQLLAAGALFGLALALAGRRRR